MDPRLKFIDERRSVRRYTDEPVSEEEIQAMIEAGAAAPSANNSQPWRFVVVTERGTLDRMVEVYTYGKMLAHAPLALVVCADPKASPHYWEQDCAAATENILLAAAALGLGAVWLGTHPKSEREEGVRALLGIPEEIKVLSSIAVGRPDESPPRRGKLEAQWVHRERW
jgi:nitroreductase